MQGMGGGVATQGPYAGQPINQIPWMTPQQRQEYQRTGMLPQTQQRQAANPPAPDAQVVHNPDGTLTANIPGRGRVTVSRKDENGNQMTDAETISKYAKQVSDRPVEDSGGGTSGPYPNSNLQGRVANVMAAGGMSPNAIAGVFQNITDESGWIPGQGSSHYDQPRFSRNDARAYSHGLYQEGGDDWPAFQRFLNGRDWRDPTLQTQFMMQNFKQKDPQGFAAMNNARTPGEAAQIFVRRYLKPAPQYLSSRWNRYGRGVAGLERIFNQRQANIPINPVTGHPYTPARAGDRWFFGLNPDGSPKSPQQRDLERMISPNTTIPPQRFRATDQPPPTPDANAGEEV
jgi:hypothetical protein